MKKENTEAIVAQAIVVGWENIFVVNILVSVNKKGSELAKT